MWVFWIQVGLALLLLVGAFSVGTLVERHHFKTLAARERELADIFLTDLSKVPGRAEYLGLVSGQVVIGSDYFKSVAAHLRNLIGGRVRTFETLMERARREAIVRMTQAARDVGADQVINVRMVSSDIGSGQRRNPAAMVEMYAYGTAVRTIGGSV